jgi:hypothetical protein
VQVKLHRVDEARLYLNPAAVDGFDGETKGFYLPLEKIRQARPAGNQNRIWAVYIQGISSTKKCAFVRG